MVVPMGSASQNPVGGQGREAGKEEKLWTCWRQSGQGTGDRKRSTSTKASTAALSPFSQRLLLPGDAFRATRLAARNGKKGIEPEPGFGRQSYIQSPDIIST